MWTALHYLVVGIYLAAPLVMALADAMRRSRSSSAAPSAGMLVTLCAGALMGTMLTIIYGVATGGTPSILQICMAVYFSTSLLAILKAFDSRLRAGVEFVSDKMAGRGKKQRWAAVGAASTIRLVLLFGLGLPYVMASVVTYRPKVVSADTPQSQLGFDFELVEFYAEDGIRISGWWIPALQGHGLREPRGTVVICHGLASSKANQMVIARSYVPHGYNVLIFDFRAHGESGGQFASFGDLERRDVLAAVRWIRANHPGKPIFGVGASMGAAALIAAAADPSEDGQAIHAVAVYGTFDDLSKTANQVAELRFPFPLKQAIQWFGLPLASAQVGSNLTQFSPARMIGDIWPRPVMIIHGTNDEIIPFERGQALYDAAYQPRQYIWLEKNSHNSVINDDEAAKRVRVFFDTAQSLPII